MTTRIAKAAPFLAVLSLLALVSPAVLAIGDTVGRIRGVVREASSKEILPGIEVSIASPVLIGGAKKAVTDANGNYEFVNLPPGSYEVTASLGINPMLHRVIVRANEATPVEFALSATLMADNVDIVEERHITRPDTSTTGANFTMDKQNNLPVARQYQSIVTLTPGVTQNGTGNPYVKGANNRQNKILIDGLDTSDPLTQTFSANINQDSLQSVQILTGGFEAKYNAIGSIQNLVTNSGSDELHFDVSFYTQAKATQDFFLSGANLYDGPRPFSNAEAPPSSRLSAAVNVNGPIIKQKLWFSLGLEWDRSAAVTPAGPPLNVQAPNRVFADWYPRLKITWAPSDSDRVMVEGIGDPTTIDYALNTGAAANTTDLLASATQLQGGAKAIAEWDHFFTPNLDSKVFAGYSYSYIEAGAQGDVRGGVDGYDPNRSGHVNLDDNTNWYNRQQYQRSGRHRVQFDGSLTWRNKWMGDHTVEGGYQSSIVQYKQVSSYYGGGNFYTDRGGGPLSTGLCDADPALTPTTGVTGKGCLQLDHINDAVQHSHGWTFGVYLQDRYKPNPWLTVLPGLRFDTSHAWLPDFGDNLSLSGWGPRLSAIADLTGDEKTIFQLSYGHSTEMTYLSPFNVIDGARKSVATSYNWDPVNKVFNQAPGASISTTVKLSDGYHKAPHSDEFLASFRRELTTNTTATAEYTYKRVSNIVEFVESNVIYDPSGNRVIGGRDGTKNYTAELSYPDANKSYYSGLDLIVESKPTPAIDIFAAYTLSYTWGPGYQNANNGGGITTPGGRTDQFVNPRQAAFVGGFQPGIDTRHNFKTAITYNFFKGATIGTVITWRSGIAQQKQFQNNANNPPRWRTPNGLEPGTLNDTTQWTEVRTPDALVVNLSARYDLFDLARQHVIVTVDVFNLFDSYTATAIRNGDTAPPSTFGGVTGRLTPFAMQLGVRYQY